MKLEGLNILCMEENLDSFYNDMVISSYSKTKNIHFATMLNKKNKVFFLTSNESKPFLNIPFLSIKNITKEFLDKIDIIYVMNEISFVKFCQTNKYLESKIFDLDLERNNLKVIFKTETLNWIHTKRLIQYLKDKHNIVILTFVFEYINIILLQNLELLQDTLKKLEKKYNKKALQTLESKVYYFSTPINITASFNNKQIYTLDHSYCVHYINGLKPNRALHPLLYTKEYINKKSIYTLEYYNTNKIKLIYVGKIIHNDNVFKTLKELMEELGNDYELHLYITQFTIPNFNGLIHSGFQPNKLQLLRDCVFYNNPNIIVHYPYTNEEEKNNAFNGIEYGLDFCINRNINEKNNYNSYRIIEYCMYGLKVICDKNIGNSSLINSCKNGLTMCDIMDGKNVANYILNMEKFNVDRNTCINICKNLYSYDTLYAKYEDFMLNEFDKKSLAANNKIIKVSCIEDILDKSELELTLERLNSTINV